MLIFLGELVATWAIIYIFYFLCICAFRNFLYEKIEEYMYVCKGIEKLDLSIWKSTSLKTAKLERLDAINTEIEEFSKSLATKISEL